VRRRHRRVAVRAAHQPSERRSKDLLHSPFRVGRSTIGSCSPGEFLTHRDRQGLRRPARPASGCPMRMRRLAPVGLPRSAKLPLMRNDSS
jgi:hypothetical protein